MKKLKALILLSGADLVLSSSWRHGEKNHSRLLNAFKEINLPKWIDTTGDNLGHRGAEIDAWIKANEFDGPYVILDDDDDIAPLKKNWVETSMEEGLTEEGIKDALRILNNPT